MPEGPETVVVADPDMGELADRLADNAIDTAKSLLRNTADILEIVSDRPMDQDLILAISKALARTESALETLLEHFPDSEE